MLCSMCQHGVNAAKCWTCGRCKGRHCPHIHVCPTCNLHASAARRVNERDNRLAPGGEPRWVRCYDNGGRTADRYSVQFTKCGSMPSADGLHWALFASENPFHPQGVGSVADGTLIDKPSYRHLGKPIAFRDLPVDVKIFVLNIYCDLWKLDRNRYNPRAREGTVAVNS